MEPNGSGTSPTNTFPAPFKSSICFTPASTCGIWCGVLYPGDDVGQKRWILQHQPKLDSGKIEKLVSFIRSIKGFTPELTESIHKYAGYFENNAARMRYSEFREQHLFVGSGVIEAGCKTVIGSRLKQSGMFWTVDAANAIIALRCSVLNGELEGYWENRCAA